VSKIDIDIGYGDVKVATKSGVFKFPTAISIKKNNYADFGNNTAIDFEGKQYEVA
jgi:hypothetical protein